MPDLPHPQRIIFLHSQLQPGAYHNLLALNDKPSAIRQQLPAILYEARADNQNLWHIQSYLCKHKTDFQNPELIENVRHRLFSNLTTIEKKKIFCALHNSMLKAKLYGDQKAWTQEMQNTHRKICQNDVPAVFTVPHLITTKQVFIPHALDRKMDTEKNKGSVFDYTRRHFSSQHTHINDAQHEILEQAVGGARHFYPMGMAAIHYPGGLSLNERCFYHSAEMQRMLREGECHPSHAEYIAPADWWRVVMFQPGKIVDVTASNNLPNICAFLKNFENEYIIETHNNDRMLCDIEEVLNQTEGYDPTHWSKVDSVYTQSAGIPFRPMTLN